MLIRGEQNVTLCSWMFKVFKRFTCRWRGECKERLILRTQTLNAATPLLYTCMTSGIHTLFHRKNTTNSSSWTSCHNGHSHKAILTRRDIYIPVQVCMQNRKKHYSVSHAHVSANEIACCFFHSHKQNQTIQIVALTMKKKHKSNYRPNLNTMLM